jgi:hypothetical protein
VFAVLWRNTLTKKTEDLDYLHAFLEPIRKCKRYTPAFGQKTKDGLSSSQFLDLYSADFFYNIIGLASPSIYLAHKAAGGITSIYRQIGIGSERLVQAVLSKELGLDSDKLEWSYQYPKPNGKDGVHTLDAMLRLDDLSKTKSKLLQKWIHRALDVNPNSADPALIKGAVFEIRQGYKSADSKRQNADLRFGMRAYQSNMLPVFLLLSEQISSTVSTRYQADGMLVLSAVQTDDDCVSTYAFFRNVVGYDLAAFFKRNSTVIQKEVRGVAKALLTV